MADQNPSPPPKSQALTLHQQQFALVKSRLEAAKQQLQAVLPRHIEAERVIRIAMLAISGNDKLLQCKPRSILVAVAQACQLGLEPGGVMGLAYLVPYKDECQLIPGYRGYVELARRSGLVHHISAACVYEGEHFKMRRGLQEVLEHEPVVAREVGPFKGAYAIARMKAGPPQWDFMDCYEIETIRERSEKKKLRDDGPWQSDYGEMAKKTVIRRLSKLLPRSPEMAAAYELDNRLETGERTPTEILDITDTIEVAAEPERFAAPPPPRTAAPPPAAASAPVSTPASSAPAAQPQPASSARAPDPASAPAAPAPNAPAAPPRRSDPPPDAPNPKAEEIRQQMAAAPATPPEPGLPPSKADDWGLNPSERAQRFKRSLDEANTEADVKKVGTAYNADLKTAIAEAEAKKPPDRAALQFLQIERAESLKAYNERIRLVRAQEQKAREEAVDGTTLAVPPAREREPGEDDEEPTPAGAA